MELLKTFILPKDGDGPKITREACRAIVFDENNLMPLIFVSKKNYHKLPGGGIEGNEDKITALKREFKEEVGCDIEVTKEIGMVVEQNSTREHTSYAYIGKVIKKGKPNLIQEEKDRGYLLKRVSIDDAISLLQKDVPNDPYGYRIIERDLVILLKAKKLC